MIDVCKGFCFHCYLRRLTVLMVLGFLFTTTSSIFAGNADTLNNFSAEWCRTLNRNAATDSADTVVYNPAGTIKLEDGVYLSITGQYVYKEFWDEVNGMKYDSDYPTFIPGIFSLFKKDRWAAFAAYTIVSGGGKVKYKDGSATTAAFAELFPLGSPSQYLEADSNYHAYTLGLAFALTEKLSGSLGIRYVDARLKREIFISPLSLKYREEDLGLGAILGLNLSPTKELNIGIRYETKTSLYLKTKVRIDNLGFLTDGEERKRDLPALFGLGIAYHLRPNLKAEADLTYYFNENADWDDIALTIPADETEKDNGYELGFAFEYTCSPKMKVSLGCMFTDTGMDPDNMSFENPELNCYSVAGGIGYEIKPRLDINFGIIRAFFEDKTTSAGVELNKKIILLALGVQYKF